MTFADDHVFSYCFIILVLMIRDGYTICFSKYSTSKGNQREYNPENRIRTQILSQPPGSSWFNDCTSQEPHKLITFKWESGK